MSLRESCGGDEQGEQEKEKSNFRLHNDSSGDILAIGLNLELWMPGTQLGKRMGADKSFMLDEKIAGFLSAENL